MTESRYHDGSYLQANPSWHREDSPWKAQHVAQLLHRHHLQPERLCEVGCGAGQVLTALQKTFPEARLQGWDISSQAIALAQPFANSHLNFTHGDFFSSSETHDVVLALDVFEHVENYFDFLRNLRPKGRYCVFHIPLDLSAQAVVRGLPLRWRQDVGHLHYFTRDLALAALQETGYRVLEARYTAYAIDRTAPTLKARLARWPRRLAFQIAPDQAALWLGGFCLLVLAEADTATHESIEYTKYSNV